MKRVKVEEAPDEYWFECEECEGVGKALYPAGDGEPEGYDADGEPIFKDWAMETCAECNGTGVIEGDADDVD